MKVLFVESDDKLRDFFNIRLDNLSEGIEVTECISIEKARDLIRDEDHFHLVVVGHTNQLEAPELYKNVHHVHKKVPFLVLSDQDTDFWDNVETPCEVLPRDFNGKMFAHSVMSFFEQSATRDWEATGYKKVRLIYFLRFNKVLCDVYIKLNDSKFIKILKRGDNYTRGDLKKYTKKDIKYLYITAEDYEEFCVSLGKTKFLVEDEFISEDEIENALLSTMEIVHELIKDFGISEQVMNLVDYSHYQMERLLEGQDDLMNLFNKMRNRKDYIYDHSYLTAYVASFICEQMDWHSDEIREKLTYAAILHDITLEDPELAMCVDLQLPDLVNFDDSKISEFKRHPLEIGALIRANDKLPPNLEAIVENHHEKPEGTGFPNGLAAHRVSQLMGLFIVAHSFVNELYRYDFQPDKLPEMIENLKKRFSVGNYKMPLEGLLKSFQKIKVKQAG